MVVVYMVVVYMLHIEAYIMNSLFCFDCEL